MNYCISSSQQFHMLLFFLFYIHRNRRSELLTYFPPRTLRLEKVIQGLEFRSVQLKSSSSSSLGQTVFQALVTGRTFHAVPRIKHIRFLWFLPLSHHYIRSVTSVSILPRKRFLQSLPSISRATVPGVPVGFNCLWVPTRYLRPIFTSWCCKGNL